VPRSRYLFWRVSLRLFIPILLLRFQIICLRKAVDLAYLFAVFVNYFIIQVGNLLRDLPGT
jgi:hypothetical protein